MKWLGVWPRLHNRIMLALREFLPASGDDYRRFVKVHLNPCAPLLINLGEPQVPSGIRGFCCEPRLMGVDRDSCEFVEFRDANVYICRK